MADSTSAKPGGSRLISRVLPSAIRLWLQTQLEHVEDLFFCIEGCDREILSGHIPEVVLSARKAVYQGIHLSQIAVKASGIRINLGQVIRRKPLRLLTPFPVSGDLRLTTADLNQSLQAPLLGEGIYDLLQLIANAQPEAAFLEAALNRIPQRTVFPYYQPSASIGVDGIVLRLTPQDGYTLPLIAIATALVVRDGHRLCLENPRWLFNLDTDNKTLLPDLQDFEIDLGSEVTLTKCEIQNQYLSLAGTIRVLPEGSVESSPQQT